jgi:hypothetical protein
MKRLLGSIIVLIAIATQAGDSYAILDQQNVFTSIYAMSIAQDFAGAQTVTCGMAGILSRVDVKVSKGSATTDDLLMSLWSTASDGSLLSKLSTSSLPASSIPTSSFGTAVSFDTFSLPVVPGEVIGIRLDTAAPNTPPYDLRYNWLYDTPGHYSGGHVSRYYASRTEQVNADFWFQTFVMPIPEPSITLLTSIGMMLWVRHHRKGAG